MICLDCYRVRGERALSYLGELVVAHMKIMQLASRRLRTLASLAPVCVVRQKEYFCTFGLEYKLSGQKAAQRLSHSFAEPGS